MPPKPAPRRSNAADNSSPIRGRTPIPKPRPRPKFTNTYQAAEITAPVKLLATELPSSCSEDLLINYFERKKNFGRALNVDRVEYDSSRNRAIVIFESNTDLRTVLETHERSPCVLSKKEIHVEEFKEDTSKLEESPRTDGSVTKVDASDSFDDIDSETKLIVVKGYSDEKSTDPLRYYFENGKRSGGGEVISLVPDREAGYILITFAGAKVVQSVLDQARQNPHVVEGCHLRIKPFLISKTDVLFKNIPESASEESLKNFLEARLGVEVSQGHLAYNAAMDRAVVKFNEAVDMEAVEKVCEQRPIEGTYLTPMPVRVTNAVLVTNLPDDVSEDTCRFYFENHRKSGGGAIEEIDFQPDEGYCLISFEKPENVTTVSDKMIHRVMGAELTVTPYHVCLGKPSSFGNNQPWVVPVPVVTQSQHEYKLKYLHNREKDKVNVEESLKALHAVVKWKEKPAVIECTLSTQTKGYRKLGKTWAAEVQKELNNLMNSLDQHIFVTNPEVFPLFRKELNSLDMLYPDEAAVLTYAKITTVVLVATKTAFRDAVSKIQNKLDGAVNEVAKQKEKISKRKNMKEWQVRYLQMKKFKNNINNNFSNVTIEMDAIQGFMEVTGPQTDVNDVVLAAFEQLQNVREKHVEISKEAVVLLQDPETQQIIREQMRQQGLMDIWTMDEDSVTLFTDETEDFTKKKMIFKRFYTQIEFEVDAASGILQREDKWSELTKTLADQFKGCFVMNKVGSNIKICCRNDVDTDIKQMCQQFLDKNSIFHEELRVEKYTLQFVQRYMETEIQDEIRTIQGRSEVKMEYTQSDKVIFHGTAEALSSARALFKRLIGKVVFQKRPLKKPGIVKYMTSTKGQESIKSIERNTPCIIHMVNSIGDKTVVVDQSQTLQILGLTQTCADATLPTGQRVAIYGGNMLQLKVDVIVNTANEEMKHTGGLAAAIIKAGGRSIQKECSDLVAKHGSVAIGNVLVSGSGNLPSKYIIHAVGPRWAGGTNQEPELLQAVIENCLLESDKRQCQSIALPALCTGVYRYPVDQACDLIVTTIHQYFQNQTTSRIREVYLCDINPKTVNTFIKGLSSIVGLTQQPDGGRNHSPPPTVRKSDSSAKTTSGTTTVFGNTQVEVVKGNIATQKADVIVNSASSDLNLSKGKASETLLKAAGRSIQDECSTKYPNGISTGEVAVTTGGSLNCKYILHIALDPFSHKKSVESLESCVQSCLTEADKLRAQSIAFPVLGTGNQGFPVEIVAESMFKCASNYCRRFRDTTSITSLTFVVFHKDTKIYEVFLSTINQSDTSGKPVDKGQVEKQMISTSKGKSIESQQGELIKRKAKPWSYLLPFKGRSHPSKGATDATSKDGAQRIIQTMSSDSTGDECVLTIYADDDRKVDGAFNCLDKMINDDWYSQKFDDPDVLKLDQKQIDHIKAVAQKNDVEVNVDLDVGGIEIHGLIGNVMPVKDLIYQELREFDKGVHEKKHAELLTSVVQWFWIDNANSKPFTDVDIVRIEGAYKNKEAKVTITDKVRNDDFEIDFSQMEKYFVKDSTKRYPVIRRDLIADSSTELPTGWEAMGTDENLRMVKLVDSSTEYKDVLADFTKTLGRTPNIIEIHRIQNRTLYTQYAAKRRLMEINNPGIKNEYILWHGTDALTVPSITTHGYNRSYCGKNAVVYGEGVYFAVNAQYSDRNGYARPEQGTGHKRMYRARVLVGHYALGVSGMRVPPVRVNGNPDILYDSVTNNTQDPAMFVIFHDAQAYPEHIITYT